MSWGQGIACILVANLLVLAPMVLVGHAGVKYGVPFPVLARSSFGVRGAVLPALLRGGRVGAGPARCGEGSAAEGARLPLPSSNQLCLPPHPASRACGSRVVWPEHLARRRGHPPDAAHAGRAQRRRGRRPLARHHRLAGGCLGATRSCMRDARCSGVLCAAAIQREGVPAPGLSSVLPTPPTPFLLPWRRRLLASLHSGRCSWGCC